MITTFRAELVKVLRARVLAITAVATAIFAVGSTLIVLAAAEPDGARGSGRDVTIASLSDAGGGTEVFTTAISFVGTLLFVLFVGVVAVEFSRGTFRTMLMHQPRRIRLLAGKVAALLAVAAVVLAAAEVLSWAVARLFAPSQDVATGQWLSLDALGQGIADFRAVLFWVTGYAVLGTMVAVLARSVPVALAVGIAWAGPFEHLLQDAWDPASRFFPGLLLEAFVAGGTADVDATRAFVTVAAYAAAAAVVAGTVFARRDMTA
jgi:ABC-2 type transport system permease protein